MTPPPNRQTGSSSWIRYLRAMQLPDDLKKRYLSPGGWLHEHRSHDEVSRGELKLVSGCVRAEGLYNM